MKNAFKALLIGFISLFVLSNTGLADKKVYTVGVEALKYMPHYDHDNKEYIGMARDLLDMFADTRGYKFRYKIRPIKKLFSEFLNKKTLDLKYPDNSYWQGEMKKGKSVIYSQPVVEYIDGVMVLPEHKGKGSAKLKRLGTVRGFTTWEYLEMVEKGDIKLVENSTFTGLIKQVLKKRINGAYFNVAVCNYQLTEVMKKPGALVFDETLPHTKSHYYLSTLNFPKLINEFNNFLIKEKPAIDALKNKYQVQTK